MKKLNIILLLIIFLFQANGFTQESNSTLDSREESLNKYWADLAEAAKEGNFEGMKSLYHQDAVVVKPDTTFAVSRAFKVRWKKEILEVKNGKRANTLAFRFSKRIGDNNTAFEKGIYHYTSVDTATGNVIGDAYIHFETLLVKVNNRWVTLMEYQQEEATETEWNALK